MQEIIGITLHEINARLRDYSQFTNFLYELKDYNKPDKLKERIDVEINHLDEIMNNLKDTETTILNEMERLTAN